MSQDPPMLFGLSPDPDDPTPTLIPRTVAEEIRAKSPAMAMALGITEEALRTGALSPATASPHDFPELRTLGANVLPEDMPRNVVQTLRQRVALQRIAPRPTMGPADALNLHAELRESMRREGMHKWLGVWLTGYNVTQVDHADEIPGSVERVGVLFAASVREALREASTYLMAAEANPLLTAAAEGLPWTVVPELQLPPSPSGFLAFAAPYEIADADANTMSVRAISWQTSPTAEVIANLDGWPDGVTDGILVTFWNSFDDDEGPRTPHEQREFDNVRARTGTRLCIAQSLPIPVGVPLQDWPTFRGLIERGHAEGVTGPVALVIATWMLMRQPIVSQTRGSMPPKVRKEIRKRGRIRGDVSVINLRQRPAPERLPAEGEPVKREYHWRWTVKAHWRNQACGPGRTERQWILIFAHIKGPADAPLKQRARVYRVSGRP